MSNKSAISVLLPHAVVVGVVVALIGMQPNSPEQPRVGSAASGATPAAVTLPDMVGLSGHEMNNLRLQTAAISEGFETTEFALGRLEEIPSKRSVLSSRISGRVAQLDAFSGDQVSPGQVLAQIESRQPANQPAIVPLASPTGGIVTSTDLRIGKPVNPETPLLEICDRSTLWAIAKIPEAVVPEIRIGSRARIQIPALGSEPLVATLTRWGVDADSASRSVGGIFEISNKDGRLQPGMRAEFHIITGERADSMAVPLAALQGGTNPPMVFVKDFSMPFTFVRVPVEIGERNDRFAEITSGLFPGDEVVTDGSYQLSLKEIGLILLEDEFKAYLDSVNHCAQSAAHFSPIQDLQASR